jgi:hypothetical protein
MAEEILGLVHSLLAIDAVQAHSGFDSTVLKGRWPVWTVPKR